MATFQIADFSILSDEYVSVAEDGNVWAEVKLCSQLGSSYVDVLTIGKYGGGKFGTRQQERARELRDELLQQITDVVKASGWEISDSLGFTSYKRPIGNAIQQDTVTPLSVKQQESATLSSHPAMSNVVSQDSVTPVRDESGKQQITVGSHTRTIATKSVTFRCAQCGATVTQQRYPSPRPMYCRDECRKNAERAQTKLRVQRLRAGHKQASKV